MYKYLGAESRSGAFRSAPARWVLFADEKRAVFLPKESRGDWLSLFFMLPIQFASVLTTALYASQIHNGLSDVGVTTAPTFALVLGMFLPYSAVRASHLRTFKKRFELTTVTAPERSFLITLDGTPLPHSLRASLCELLLPGGSRGSVLLLDSCAILLYLEWTTTGSGGHPNRSWEKWALQAGEGSEAVEKTSVGDDGPFAVLHEGLGRVIQPNSQPAAIVSTGIDDDVPLEQLYRSPMLYRWPTCLALGALLAWGFYEFMSYFVGNVWKIEASGARLAVGILVALLMLALQALVFGTWLRVGFGRAIDRKLRQLAQGDGRSGSLARRF